MTKGDPGTPIQVLGEEFRIAGASPERVRDLAAFVERRFREEQAARPAMDFKRLAVVVCLTLAEELYDERSRRRGLETREVGHAERVRRCREALEGACAPFTAH